MSLIAHWPLNGNADDISGNGFNGTPTNVTYTAGKIGQAASFNGTSYYTVDNVIPISEMSFSFFMKTTALSNQNILSCRTAVGYGVSIFFLSGTSFRFDTGISYQWVPLYTVPQNKWIHVTFTRDNNYKKLYINGELIDSTTEVGVISDLYNIMSVGASNASGGSWGNYLYGQLNDLRVYDYALTDMEIKEIARAKILHYTFDDMQEPTTNLHNDPTLDIRYSENSIVSKSNWGVDGTLYARKSDCPIRNDNSLMLEISITSTGSGGLYTDLSRYLPSNTFTLVEGKTYTRSWWIKSDQISKSISGHVCSCNRGSDNLYLVGNSITVTNKWQRFEHTFTVGVGQGGEFHTRHIIYNDIFTVWITNIQVEEKGYATEFVNRNRIGSVKDYSGFFNHSDELTELYTPQWVTDSKLGKASYKFNNSGTPRNFITKSSFYTPDNITMMVWFKANEAGYGTYHIPLSIDTTNFEIAVSSSGVLRTGYNISGTRRIVDTGANLLDGQWHLIGSTYDGQTIRAYKDGIMINSAEWPGTLRRGYYTVGIGQFANNNSYGTKGYEDSVQIYATALSDEDILDLYETRAEIEESGVLYAKSFLSNVEETKNIIYEHIILKNNTTSYSTGSSNYRVIIIENNINDGSERIYSRFTGDVNNDSNAQTFWNFTERGLMDQGVEMTFSVDLKGSGTCHLTLYDDNTGYKSGQTITLTDQWKRYSLTRTFGNYTSNHWCAVRGIVETTDVFVSNAQLELKPYPTSFTSTYRPYIELPSNVTFGENEILEQGIATYEDFSTAGIVDGIIGFWTLNDNVNDYSGNDYHGNNFGAISYGDYYKFNNASMITIPQLPSFKQISIIAKIRRSTNTDWDGIFGTQGSVLHFQLEASGRLNAYLYGSVSLGTNTGINYITADGEWHLAVLTFDGTNLKLYKDDILDSTAIDTSPGGELPSSNSYRIGLAHDTTRYFNGDIAYVKLFNRALTAEEISIEYNTMVKNEVQFHDFGKVYAKRLKQY